jgi:hypothetical protein
MINISASGGPSGLSRLDGLNKYKRIRECTGGGQTTPWFPTSGNTAPTLPSSGASTILYQKPPGSSGFIDTFNFDLQADNFGQDGRFQVFVDQYPIPYIDVDLGTLFGGHYDGQNLNSGPYFSRNTSTAYYGSGYPTRVSGSFRFPIYYSNGITIRVANYGVSGALSLVFANVYSLVGVPQDPRRLRSFCLPRVNAVTLTKTTPVVFFTTGPIKGYVVFYAFASKGTNPDSGDNNNLPTFLEKNHYYATDGETVTIDGYGNPQGPGFNGGGTEDDTFLVGWYYVGRAAIGGCPWGWVTSNSTASITGSTTVGTDLLELCGGIQLNGISTAGKGWGGVSTSEIFNHCSLLYVDTSVPSVPGVPTISGSAGSGSVTLTVNCMQLCQGSSGVTSFAGTYTGGGGGTFTIPASAFGNSNYLDAVPMTHVISGLTTGTAYTFSIKAVNATGQGPASNSVTVTPS